MREQERNLSFIFCFTSWITGKPGTGPGQNQKPGTSSPSPIWAPRPKHLDHLLLLPPCINREFCPKWGNPYLNLYPYSIAGVVDHGALICHRVGLQLFVNTSFLRMFLVHFKSCYARYGSCKYFLWFCGIFVYVFVLLLFLILFLVSLSPSLLSFLNNKENFRIWSRL